VKPAVVIVVFAVSELTPTTFGAGFFLVPALFPEVILA